MLTWTTSADLKMACVVRELAPRILLDLEHCTTVRSRDVDCIVDGITYLMWEGQVQLNLFACIVSKTVVESSSIQDNMPCRKRPQHSHGAAEEPG